MNGVIISRFLAPQHGAWGTEILWDPSLDPTTSFLTPADMLSRYPFEDYGMFVQINILHLDPGVWTVEMAKRTHRMPGLQPALHWPPNR